MKRKKYGPGSYTHEGGYTFKGFLSNIFYGFSYKEKIENFHLDKVSQLGYKDMAGINGSFHCRFLYGIYDSDQNKGWIRCHGIPKEHFFIQVGFNEKNYYEGQYESYREVYTDMKSRYKWPFIKNKDAFKYNSSDQLLSNKDLYYTLCRYGATTKFIKDFLVGARFNWRGSTEYRKVFFSQLALLKGLLKDEEKEKLRRYPTDNVNEEYLEKFGYSPEEKFIENYLETFEYLGIENRVLFSSRYNQNIIDETNLEKRKALVYSKFDKLFPNEKING